MISPKFLKAFGQITTADRALVITHTRPDGDAVASACAVMEMLELLGKDYLAYCHDTPPDQFKFLPHFEKFISRKNQLDLKQFDVIIVVDCGQLDRTGLTEEIKNRDKGQYVIEIDHHPKIYDYADLEIRQPETSSTAELLYNFFRANLVKINKNLATCILTGILTDTGNLLYDITSDKTIKVASDMLRAGARLPVVHENTLRNKSVNAMKMWGLAMSRLRINNKYNIATTILTREDFKRFNVSDEDLEGAPGFFSNTSDAKALLFLRELDNGQLKGSLRSMNNKIDISLLARRLGGGGHPKSSAFVMDGKLIKDEEKYRIE